MKENSINKTSKQGNFSIVLDEIINICKTLSNISSAILVIWFLGSAILYVKYFIFELNEYPDFGLNEFLAFGFHNLFYILIIATIPYFCYESLCIFFNTKIKKKNKIIDTISNVAFIVIFCSIHFLFLLVSLLFLENDDFLDEQLDYIYQITFFYLFSIIVFTFKPSCIKYFRIFYLVCLVLYFIFTNLNIEKRAGIGNYKADVMVYVNDNVIDYLKERGIDINDKSCYENNKMEESNTKKLKICKTAKGNLRFNDIKILSSIGKKTFLEYDLDDKNKIRLIFDTKQVDILEKFNIPFKTTK
ncbi:hypothetical protein AVCANL279_04790 [Campylobacter canadensis]|uniref:hypothetical protein n=2 Tax=Campylobacter canadensis TaxID=449520 RepID=UPI001CC90A64|nr:hypothetical protein [Campylobacter canadensis]MBZ7996642.1 hypothetical protein [Campylobacter canadensis]MBZ8000249.1 hypothetical protein [Campylobacter canadensis]MBZ8002271.1 hypothetical protein [Campylobacter canadensis]